MSSDGIFQTPEEIDEEIEHQRHRLPPDFPLPARIRAQAARTDHVPKGCWGQRRRATADPVPPVGPLAPDPLDEAA